MADTLPPRFTLSDAERAHSAWGANCGPTALAAILGLTLDQVRPLILGFDKKGYVNPTMMFDALARAGVRWRASSLRPSATEVLSFPSYGLARLQWEGPWTLPEVNPRARYAYTHWVGSKRAKGSVKIFDVNAMESGAGWRPFEDWCHVAKALTASVHRANGKWHITHSIEVPEPVARDLRMAG